MVSVLLAINTRARTSELGYGLRTNFSLGACACRRIRPRYDLSSFVLRARRSARLNFWSDAHAYLAGYYFASVLYIPFNLVDRYDKDLHARTCW